MDARCRGLLVLLIAMAAPRLFAANHDFDGDGHDDVAWRNAITGEDAWWRSGEPTRSHALVAVENLQWNVVAIADFDGDGRADLFWRNAANGRNAIWRGANGRSVQAVPTVPDIGWHILGTGDFDGDGHSDVVWEHPTKGHAIWFGADASRAEERPATLKFVGIADVTGDGYDEIMGHRPFLLGGELYFAWFAGNPKLETTVGVRPTFGMSNWKLQGTGDFDGDGREDLFWRNTRDGRDVLWLGGHAGDEVQLMTIPELAWDVVAAGDYDGDGRCDLFWRNRTTGEVGTWPHADGRRARLLAHVSTQWVVVP